VLEILIKIDLNLTKRQLLVIFTRLSLNYKNFIFYKIPLHLIISSITIFPNNSLTSKTETILKIYLNEF